MNGSWVKIPVHWLTFQPINSTVDGSESGGCQLKLVVPYIACAGFQRINLLSHAVLCYRSDIRQANPIEASPIP